MQERCKRSRFNLWGQEDPLGEGTETHSSILAWRMPWTEETGGLQSKESDTTWSDFAQRQRGRMGWRVEGRFKREETHVHLWLISVVIWQKQIQHCKAIILQFKIKSFFLKLTSPFLSQWTISNQLVLPQLQFGRVPRVLPPSSQHQLNKILLQRGLYSILWGSLL